MANIDKELNQIKNAVYGREVRGSIHDGIDKINKETEIATGKADEAHDVMESIINDGFDNAALEANFEQKLDDKIADLQPEWTQFKEDTASQLADTALNARSFGATGNGSEQSAEIQAAINSLSLTGGTVLIPSGVYLIDNTILLPDNIVLRGVNDKTVLKLTPGQSRPIISNADPENGNINIRIESLKLDGNRKNQSSDGNLPYPWAGLILFKNVKQSTI